jgi:hypothetical protein
MSKFKAGDKVVSKVNVSDKLVRGEEYTVCSTVGSYGSVRLEEHQELGQYHTFSPLSFYTLAESQQATRNALEAAIKLCHSYDLGMSNILEDSVFCNNRWRTNEQALDELFPPETPQQKEIARIEAEMHKLSNDLAKLKN